MSKFMDTNYHYLCPELSNETFPTGCNWSTYTERTTRAQNIIGRAKAVPMVIGPLTLVSLAKGDFNRSEMINRLVPCYIELLVQLQQLQVPEVQVWKQKMAFYFLHHYRRLRITISSTVYTIFCTHCRLRHCFFFHGKGIMLDAWVPQQFTTPPLLFRTCNLQLLQRMFCCTVSIHPLLLSLCYFALARTVSVTNPLADVEGTLHCTGKNAVRLREGFFN